MINLSSGRSFVVVVNFRLRLAPIGALVIVEFLSGQMPD